MNGLINSLTVQTIVDKILDEPTGITLGLDGRIPSFNDGFYVATTDNRVEIREISQVVVHIVGNRGSSEELFIGSWQADDGFYCIDKTLHLEDHNQAMQLAVQHNQDAIFDIRNNLVLPTRIPYG